MENFADFALELRTMNRTADEEQDLYLRRVAYSRERLAKNVAKKFGLELADLNAAYLRAIEAGEGHGSLEDAFATVCDAESLPTDTRDVRAVIVQTVTGWLESRFYVVSGEVYDAIMSQIKN